MHSPGTDSSVDYFALVRKSFDTPVMRLAGLDDPQPYVMIGAHGGSSDGPRQSGGFSLMRAMQQDRVPVGKVSMPSTENWIANPGWHVASDASTRGRALLPTFVYRPNPEIVISLPAVEAPYFCVAFFGNAYQRIVDGDVERLAMINQLVGAEITAWVSDAVQREPEDIAEEFGYTISTDPEDDRLFLGNQSEFFVSAAPEGLGVTEIGQRSIGLDAATLQKQITSQWAALFMMVKESQRAQQHETDFGI